MTKITCYCGIVRKSNLKIFAPFSERSEFSLNGIMNSIALAISDVLSYNKLKLSIRLWRSGTLWLQRWNVCPVKCCDREQLWQTRLQEPHKRGCISKRISKNFLEIFLEIAMPYGVRIFWDSNKKEPKTLVNTGLSASFIVRYRLLKFLNFRQVDVPWKPFVLWTREFESHTLRHKPRFFRGFLRYIADCKSQKSQSAKSFFNKYTTDFSPFLWYNLITTKNHTNKNGRKNHAK